MGAIFVFAIFFCFSLPIQVSKKSFLFISLDAKKLVIRVTLHNCVDGLCIRQRFFRSTACKRRYSTTSHPIPCNRYNQQHKGCALPYDSSCQPVRCSTWWGNNLAA